MCPENQLVIDHNTFNLIPLTMISELKKDWHSIQIYRIIAKFFFGTTDMSFNRRLKLRIIQRTLLATFKTVDLQKHIPYYFYFENPLKQSDQNEKKQS